MFSYRRRPHRPAILYRSGMARTSYRAGAARASSERDRDPLAGSYWPEGGRTYQVQVRFVPTSGDAYMAALYEL